MSVRLSVSWDAPCKTVLRIEVPLHVMTTGNQSSGVLDRGATPPLERGNYRVGLVRFIEMYGQRTLCH